MKVDRLIMGIVFLIYLILITNFASAGACGMQMTVQDTIGNSSIIFSGKLSDIANTTNYSGTIMTNSNSYYLFNVIKSYKGDVSGEIKLKHICDTGICLLEFFTKDINKEYLIYANDIRGDIVFDDCGDNVKLLSSASRDISILENLDKGAGCKSYYWLDDNNKSCEQKEFCGTYMYQGLQTFESKEQCEGALNNTSNIINKTLPGEGKVKILPETASARAKERLGELGFNITLKEVGGKAVYEVRGEKEGKMLGLFKVKGKVSAIVDAETGQVGKVHKPWWAFMASRI